MLITCPSCASEYDIDPSRIGPAGRKVRCAACRESWMVGGLVESPPSAAAEQAEIAERPELASDVVAVAVEPTEEVPSEVELALPVPALMDAEAPSAKAPVIEPEADLVRRRPEAPKGKRKRKVRRSPARPEGRLGRRLAAAAAATILIATPAAILARAQVVAAIPRTASLFAALGMPVNLVGLSFSGITSTLGRRGSGPVLEVEGRIVNAGRDPRRVPPLILVVEDEAGQPLYTWPGLAEEPEVGPAGQVAFTAKLASPPSEGRRVKVSFGEAAAAPARTAAADAPRGTAHEVASP